jgi:hypothetical protein
VSPRQAAAHSPQARAQPGGPFQAQHEGYSRSSARSKSAPAKDRPSPAPQWANAHTEGPRDDSDLELSVKSKHKGAGRAAPLYIRSAAGSSQSGGSGSSQDYTISAVPSTQSSPSSARAAAAVAAVAAADALRRGSGAGRAPNRELQLLQLQQGLESISFDHELLQRPMATAAGPGGGRERRRSSSNPNYSDGPFARFEPQQGGGEAASKYNGHVLSSGGSTSLSLPASPHLHIRTARQEFQPRSAGTSPKRLLPSSGSPPGGGGGGGGSPQRRYGSRQAVDGASPQGSPAALRQPDIDPAILGQLRPVAGLLDYGPGAHAGGGGGGAGQAAGLDGSPSARGRVNIAPPAWHSEGAPVGQYVAVPGSPYGGAHQLAGGYGPASELLSSRSNTQSVSGLPPSGGSGHFGAGSAASGGYSPLGSPYAAAGRPMGLLGSKRRT